MIRLAGRASPALAVLALALALAPPALGAPKKKKAAATPAATTAAPAATPAPATPAPGTPAAAPATPPEEVPPAFDPELEGKQDNDDPNKPDALTIAEPPPEVVYAEPVRKVSFTKAEYPIEITDRPLSLPRSMGEIALDLPFFVQGDVKAIAQVLRGAYGVTNRWEIGLTYAPGVAILDPESKYQSGKAFSIDGRWQVLPDWVAIQASLAFQVSDPFAMALGLGAPFRLRLGDKIRIVGGHDLLRFKIAKFPVDPANPAANAAASAGLAVNIDPAEVNLAINLAAQYQHKPNLMFFFTFDNFFPDLTVDDHPVSTFLGVTWSKSNRFDVGARVGAYRLDEVGDSLGATVSLALRL